MKLPKLLTLGPVARRALKELSGIHQQLTRQNDLLARLADRFAPAEPVNDPDAVRAESSIEYTDAIQGGMILDYIEKVRHETGHMPDEEEILIWLADGKTLELQARLEQREVELQRLQASRRERYGRTT